MWSIKGNHLIQALVIALGLLFLYWLHAVVVLVFVVFMIVVILQPLVRVLKRVHMPAFFAVLLPIFAVGGLIALMITYVLPSLVQNTTQFIDQLPHYVHDLTRNSNIHIDVKSLKNDITHNFGSVSKLVFEVTAGVTKAFVAAITILVMTIYWLGSYEPIKKTLLSYVPKKGRSRTEDIWNRVELKLGSWFRAQVLLSLVMGVLVWIGALILGLPFAGLLGVITGLLEIIPTLGPIISAIPGIAIGFSISVEKGILTIIMYLFVHQLENHVVAPQVMGRTVRLNPIIVIISLLIGAELYGIIGVLLSVPVALFISAIVDSYRGETIPEAGRLVRYWPFRRSDR